MKTIFLRVVDAADKGNALARVIRDAPSPAATVVDPRRFLNIPTSPFSYWASDAILRCFGRLPTLEGGDCRARLGASTKNDGRYLRLAWEVAPSSSTRLRWKDFAKGGPFSPYYADIYLVARWEGNGREIEAELRSKYPYLGNNVDFVLHRELDYGHPGLTWSLRTTSGLSMRVMPGGCIYGHKGPAITIDGDPAADLLALLAVTCSKPFHSLVEVQLAAADAAARSYEVGVIQRTPVPDLSPADTDALASFAGRSWSLKRALDTRTENSHAFLLPALLQVAGDALIDRAQSWGQVTAAAQDELNVIAAEIDDYAYRLYGISAEDRQRIEQGFGASGAPELAPDDDDGDEINEEAAEIDAAPMVASLLSWSLGVAFGRFDVRLATGAHPLPPVPETFDPLPVCSPGMLTGDNGLPVDTPPPDYPLAFPADGILVDDPGHPRDLLKGVRAVFDAVFDDASARWHEAAELMSGRSGDLRDWFARTFFGEHIKRYSKSRRKAPIYWQLATASGSYSVWVYIHRATPDTLFRVLNDFVVPKLDHEREKLDRMTRDAGPNPSRADRDARAAQEAFVDELHALRADVTRVAPLWMPDLDDGVILNFAPLWRLVPQERSWQTECRKAWDKLFAGEYDWAHLAMHLWPERVVLKCAGDRSLAIAHGLEDVFWSQGGADNWHAVDVTESQVRKLIAERASQAVKAALKDLLSAPTVAATRGRKATTRRAAPKPATPALRTAAAEASVDEATLSAVKASIASVAGGASKADVLAATGLSDADWSKVIAALLDRGDITRTGQNRGSRYHADSQGEDG